MNWPFGAGWVALVLGLACVTLMVGWWWDRWRIVSLQRQIRLRGEAESDRLRLRISALKPVENRAAELTTELAGLRPVASRVPELEEQVSNLRGEVAENNRSTVELEREIAALRPRAEEADELELELAAMVSRVADVERELETQRDRVGQLERTDAALVEARGEIERLTAQLKERAEAEREMSQRVGALSEAADRHRESATVAEARADAAEILIGRRDEVIVALEAQLANRGVDETATLSTGLTGSTTSTGSTNGSIHHSPRPVPHRDDLQLISGIGPVMERRLNELGIGTWEQLAALDDSGTRELSERLPGLRGRVARDGWVSQAAELVERYPLSGPGARPGRQPAH